MKNRNEELLIDVFTGSPWEAELIKGLLESNGIPSSLKDGLMATMAPYNDEVVVQVNEENYETAMEVVRSRSKD